MTKFTNQIDFLKQLSRPREDKAEKLQESAQGIEQVKDRLSSLTGTIDERRGTIMALEGAAGRIYFDALNYIMPDRFKFEGRSRNPAKDEFNALLNYGYGAKPVSENSIYKACEFIQMLPSSFPMPQMLTEPSGEIGLE